MRKLPFIFYMHFLKVMTIELSEEYVDDYLSEKRDTNKYRVRNVQLIDQNLKDKKTINFQNRVVVGIIILAIVSWVGARVLLLSKLYEDQYKVFNTFGKFEKGEVSYTISEVAIASEYSSFYNVMNSFFASTALSKTGAKFLMLMLSIFPDHLQGKHWSSPPSGPSFEGRDYFRLSFLHWRSPNNNFSFFFETEEEFNHSLMLRCKNENPNRRSIYDDLFEGGLCRIASNQTSLKLTAPKLVSMILGKFTAREKDCKWQKRYAAVNSATNAIGAGATILGGMSAGGISFTGAGAFAAVGVAAGTAVGSFFLGKQSHESEICLPSEGETLVGKGLVTRQDVSCEEY